MGSLMFISIEDLIMDFAKDHDLKKYEILIASHDIVGSLKTKSITGGVSTGIEYESKYDNIEFINSIRPTPTVMEFAYGANNQDRYIEMYYNQLIGSEAYVDICCIVDMILNNDCNVLIVTSAFEVSAKVHDILASFFFDEFGINGYIYRDLKRISENYGTDKYEKIVKSTDYEVPETFTGRNFEVITNNVTDDIGEAKRVLEAQKVIAANMDATPGTETDITSVFVNKFTEDLETKMRELLESKDERMIKELCRQKHIRIAPGASKELLIDRIMHTIRKTVAYDINN